MKRIAYAALALTTVILSGCGDTQPPDAPAAPAAVTAPAAPAAPTAPAVEPAAAPAVEPAAVPAAMPAADAKSALAGELTGIANCDEYLNKYSACLTGVAGQTAETIAAMKVGLDATRAQWKSMSGNPQTAAALETACKAALDTLPQTLAVLGCK
jgi:hypothetical protein